MEDHNRGSPRLFFEEDDPIRETEKLVSKSDQKKNAVRKRMRESVVPATDNEAGFHVGSSMKNDDAPHIPEFKAERIHAAPAKSNPAETVKKAEQRKQTRIRFEEQKPKAPSKLRHIESVTDQVRSEIRQRITEANEDDNTAVTAVLDSEQAVNIALQEGEHAYRTHKLRQARHQEKAINQSRINLSAPETVQEVRQPVFSSNPLSRWQQKRAIRREYAAVKTGTASSYQQTVKSAGQTFRKTEETAKGVLEALRERPKGFLLILLLVLLLIAVSVLQSCTPLAQGILQALVIGTYPAEEADVLAAEQAYAAKEAALRDEFMHYTEYHPEYDSCIVNMDEIGHDPYVLIAIISAYLNGEEWTLERALPVIELYFNAQYKVTTSVRTETITEDGISREIKTCMVTLESENLSHLPVYTLSKPQLGLYALYMATHGNMEGIFAGTPGAVPLRDPELYDIPQETLDANPSFAALMEEAKKYVGYPYVWGGSSPDTSFDCAGFVCWVYSASGVSHLSGLGATGLHTACREVSAAELKPGDLVFFEGTMGESVAGITHVGIYVGNNHMLHCGSPIGYADLSDSYWQQHFHSYGRVP